MAPSKDYHQVPHEPSLEHLHLMNESSSSVPYTARKNRWKYPLIVHTFIWALYSIGFYLLYYSRKLEGVTGVSVWSPAQSAIRNKLYDYYDPALPGAEASKFVGSGLSVDSAWREVWSVPAVRLDPEDFLKIGKNLQDRPWIAIDQSLGGGYLGSIEVFHLLHCLDSLRQFVHAEEYNLRFFESLEAKNNATRHTDHCIEMLRQNLMCSSDLTPMAVYDSHVVGKPIPDFTSTHKCRDFEYLLDWAKDNPRTLHWNDLQIHNRSSGRWHVINQKAPMFEA